MPGSSNTFSSGSIAGGITDRAEQLRGGGLPELLVAKLADLLLVLLARAGISKAGSSLSISLVQLLSAMASMPMFRSRYTPPPSSESARSLTNAPIISSATLASFRSAAARAAHFRSSPPRPFCANSLMALVSAGSVRGSRMVASSLIRRCRGFLVEVVVLFDVGGRQRRHDLLDQRRESPASPPTDWRRVTASS